MKTQTGKENWILGHEIHTMLKGRGLETPMIDSRMMNDSLDAQSTTDARLADLATNTASMMQSIGLDLSDDSLMDTPKRVAKMWANELMWGLDYSNFPKATVVENKMKYDEMVLERNITVYSMCEHHLLPIIGHAYVAYIPKDTVIGLSKMNRIVEFFSRRPQIQERLTAQIFHTLCHLLGTDDVAVCIAAEHMCVKLRGVEDACSDTVTTQLGGVLKSVPSVRAEYFSAINLGK